MVLVGVFATAIMLIFWALLSDGIGWIRDSRLNVAVLHWYVEGAVVFLLPLWLILRIIYLISDRWQRSRSQQ